MMKYTNLQAGGKVPAKKECANKKIDWREQLYNEGESGPIQKVQLPEPMITSLRGILQDFDPRLFWPEVVGTKARKDPEVFCKKVVRPWLRHHPVLAKTELRISGQGVHAILWFDRPVEFATEGERQRWAGIVRVIQKLLPTDPDCPGITALTRPLGSVNSKNSGKVRRLYKGAPVTADEVLGLFEQARSSPFRVVTNLLFGSERVMPCPICTAPDSRLDALDFVGRCYGSCGKVRLSQLFDTLLKPRAGKKGGAAHGS